MDPTLPMPVRTPSIADDDLLGQVYAYILSLRKRTKAGATVAADQGTSPMTGDASTEHINLDTTESGDKL